MDSSTIVRPLFSSKSTIGGIFNILYNHVGSYATVPNINYFWNFGSLGGIFLGIQLITGILLAMFYTPHILYAFDSVDYIMRELNNGWLIRYMHANGASFFFLVIYFHIVRGMFYNSYVSPRWKVWSFGVTIFFLMMATAFIGYVLPWGQMSLWGATVITNLFSAIPVVGTDLVIWIWGGFSVDNATLNRFFSLHYLLPFVLVVLVVLHLMFLHNEGSTSPSGVYYKPTSFYLPFYPYFVIKDVATLFGVLAIYFMYVFFSPDALGHSDNYILADPLVTPAHIVPEWYFLPFYAILRSIPNKLLGVIAMVVAILIWYFLPILDSQKLFGNMRYRPIARIFFYIFLMNFILLGWVGQNVAESPFIEIGQAATFFYFAYFIFLTPALALLEGHFHNVRQLMSKGIYTY